MIRSGRGLRAVPALLTAVAALLVLPVAPTGRADDGDGAITIDPSRRLGPVDSDLAGLGWHEGGAPLSTVEALRPPFIRIDASLEEVSRTRDGPLDLSRLLERVAQVRAIGAEPLVILSYLPAWLGEEHALGRDPTRVRPSDLDEWERVVHDTVLALATAPDPALVFEAWNEPDVPLFWQDTPVAWLDTVERSARAVATVGAETGLELRFGGPATAVPDPAYLVPFVHRFRDPSLPLDFVSWHYYGNYPFFGPDGAEFPLTEPVHPLLGRPNPLTSPAAYGPQVDFVRTLVATALAGSSRPIPELVLDEWNLSAAGFDRRHDTAAGAAFAAGVLVEMQDAGLDAAAYFRANDTRGVAGGHGLVRTDGTRKPAWWTFEYFRSLAPARVGVEPGRSYADDRWALASTDGERITVLLARFRADETPSSPVPLRIDVEGQDVVRAHIRRIDGAHAGSAEAEPLEVADGDVEVLLPRPGVALVELTATRTPEVGAVPGTGTDDAAGSSALPSELPATGGSPPGPTMAVVVVVALLVLTQTVRAAGPLPARRASSSRQ